MVDYKSGQRQCRSRYNTPRIYVKVEHELKNSGFTPIKKNPLNSLINATENILNFWYHCGVFDCDIAFKDIKLNVKNANLRILYALIKIHKEGIPIRIIVSLVDSPLYIFDKCITKFLKKHLKKPKSSIAMKF